MEHKLFDSVFQKPNSLSRMLKSSASAFYFVTMSLFNPRLCLESVPWSLSSPQRCHVSATYISPNHRYAEALVQFLIQSKTTYSLLRFKNKQHLMLLSFWLVSFCRHTTQLQFIPTSCQNFTICCHYHDAILPYLMSRQMLPWMVDSVLVAASTR